MGALKTGMMRFLGKTHALFVLAAVMGLSGCAPRPWVQAASPDATDGATVIETDARSLYIIVQPADPSAPPPEVVVQQAAPQQITGWTPDSLPATNPFEKHGTWVGDYDCTQGNTGMTLRIMDVRGRVVRAIFDFDHASSGVTGSYIVTGTFDPETRRVHFDPSKWIEQPENYTMVSMSGEISTDDSLFAGKIDFRGCGAFRLKPTR